MPPSRAKLHSKTGKAKAIGNNDLTAHAARGVPSTSSRSAGNSSAANEATQQQDAEAQFEVELCWCIQQLESSLNSGKLNPKQTADVEKTIKTLKSPNQPLIKKRQIMRATFGDYRAKMAEEEKKLALGSRQIKFSDKNMKQKAFFVKKSAFLASGKDFRFNFPTNEIEQLNINDETDADNKDDKFKMTTTKNDVLPVKETNNALGNSVNNNDKTRKFHYVPSGNSFRFNFTTNKDIVNS